MRMKCRSGKKENLRMTKKEFEKKKKKIMEQLYKDNSYICGFCGKEIKGTQTVTLCECRGVAGIEIADICEDCLEKIREKVIY